MKIIPTKSKVLAVGNNNKELNMELKNQKFEQVDVYKYLGVKIYRSGNIED